MIAGVFGIVRLVKSAVRAYLKENGCDLRTNQIPLQIAYDNDAIPRDDDDNHHHTAASAAAAV
ncbi:MAG: hypothetical protein V8Q32_05990 [Anaerotignum faecicola]